MMDLTPEQKATAVQAVRDARWHDQQIRRWEKLYQKMKDAGDWKEAEKIGGIIENHQRRADTARRILRDLGF